MQFFSRASRVAAVPLAVIVGVTLFVLCAAFEKSPSLIFGNLLISLLVVVCAAWWAIESWFSKKHSLSQHVVLIGTGLSASIIVAQLFAGGSLYQITADTVRIGSPLALLLVLWSPLILRVRFFDKLASSVIYAYCVYGITFGLVLMGCAQWWLGDTGILILDAVSLSLLSSVGLILLAVLAHRDESFSVLLGICAAVLFIFLVWAQAPVMLFSAGASLIYLSSKSILRGVYGRGSISLMVRLLFCLGISAIIFSFLVPMESIPSWRESVPSEPRPSVAMTLSAVAAFLDHHPSIVMFGGGWNAFEGAWQTETPFEAIPSLLTIPTVEYGANLVLTLIPMLGIAILMLGAVLLCSLLPLTVQAQASSKISEILSEEQAIAFSASAALLWCAAASSIAGIPVLGALMVTFAFAIHLLPTRVGKIESSSTLTGYVPIRIMYACFACLAVALSLFLSLRIISFAVIQQVASGTDISRSESVKDAYDTIYAINFFGDSQRRQLVLQTLSERALQLAFAESESATAAPNLATVLQYADQNREAAAISRGQDTYSGFVAMTYVRALSFRQSITGKPEEELTSAMRRALSQFPKSPLLLYSAAQEYIRIGDRDSAMQSLRSAVRLLPSFQKAKDALLTLSQSR